MINFMHQTGECRWNQPLVTDQPMILKLGTCTFPSPSQRSRPSLRQISLKNTHSHHRLPTHQHRQDYHANPTTPDPKRHGIRAHQIQRSRLPYVYMHNTRRRKENQKRFFHSHRSKKEYQYKYSSGLSVSEEIYRSDEISKKEKSLLVSLIKTSFFGLR